MTYCPSDPVLADRVNDWFTLRKVMAASGTTAPEASVTVPVRLAVPTWEYRAGAKQRPTAAAASSPRKHRNLQTFAILCQITTGLHGCQSRLFAEIALL